VYLCIETSALNRAAKRADGLAAVRKILDRESLRPAIGTGVIYEGAKMLWSEHPVEERQRIFQLAVDLDPIYLVDLDDLISQEVRKFQRGDAVIPFLMGLDQASAKLEVARLARGEKVVEAARFTRERENRLTRSRESDAAYVEMLQERRRSGDLAHLRTLTDVAAYFRPQFPEFIRGHTKGLLDPDEATRIAARLDEFPAIRTIVNAELILLFIRIVEAQVPSRDKTPDYRHVIGAAYCTGILSADGGLLTKVSFLNPDLRPVALPQESASGT
jgi:hypothetical protein